MLHQLRLKTRFIIVIVALIVGFVLFGLMTYQTLATLKVNGPIYQQIVQGKDLVADILPPPAYIIESYLVTLQLSRASDPTEIETLIERFKFLKSDYDTRHAYWQKQTLDPEIKDLFLKRSFQSAQEFYTLAEQRFLPAIQSGNHDTAIAAQQQMRQAYDTHRTAIDEVVKLSVAQNTENETQAHDLIQSRNFGLIIIFILSIGVATTLAIVISRGIIRQIGGEPTYAAQMAQRIAESDLTCDLDTSAADENSLMAALGNMQKNLRAILTQISGYSQHLASAAEELSAVTGQTSQGIAKQGMEIAQVVTAINQMVATAQDVAQNSVHAASAAQQASHATSSGMEVLREARSSVDRLVNEVGVTSSVIQHLAQESARISMVIEVINSIAEQTNLLALNAAIEAARAGEHGRGFAVVADEVRTLATRTQQSTKEIQAIVRELQTGTSKAVAVMQQGSASARQSLQQVDQAHATLEHACTEVDTINNMNDQIAIAAEEQSAVTAEINRSIVTINEVSRESATGAQHTVSASDDLSCLATDLNLLVTKFKLPGNTSYTKK